MIEHWDTYWNEGFITSFGANFESNYKGAYQDHWFGCFAQLNRGDRVVDIATGNGGVPLLLLEYLKSNPTDVWITGTDLSRSVNLKNIQRLANDSSLDWDRFSVLAGVDSADLPFDTASVDMVTSQYGFEYSDTDKTIAEISRICRKGGRVNLVMHADTSLILDRNNAALASIDALMRSNGALAHLNALILEMGEIRDRQQLANLKHNKKAEKLRTKLNTASQQLFDKYGDSFLDCGFAEFVSELFSQHMLTPLATKKKMLAAFREQTVSHASRLRDLQNAAVSEQQVRQITSAYTQHGFVEPEVAKLSNELGELGWTLSTNKRD